MEQPTLPKWREVYTEEIRGVVQLQAFEYTLLNLLSESNGNDWADGRQKGQENVGNKQE